MPAPNANNVESNTAASLCVARMTPAERRVYDLLITGGKYQAQIAKELKIAPAWVSVLIRQLKGKNLIKETGYSSIKFYEIETVNPPITQHIKAVKPTSVSHTGYPNPSTVNKPTTPLPHKARSDFFAKIEQAPEIEDQQMPTQRLHRLYREYDLESLTSYPQGFRRVSLANKVYYYTGEYYGITCRITKYRFIVEGLELTDVLFLPSPKLLEAAERMADGLAEQAQATGDLRLKRSPDGKLLAVTKLVEIEITRHALAKRVEQRGIIPLYWNKETHKAEVWTDKSHGLDNLESNKVLYLEKLRQFTEGIVEGRWSIKDQLALNRSTMQIITAIHKELRVHRSAYRALERAATKLDKTLSQRKIE